MFNGRAFSVIASLASACVWGASGNAALLLTLDGAVDGAVDGEAVPDADCAAVGKHVDARKRLTMRAIAVLPDRKLTIARVGPLNIDEPRNLELNEVGGR